MSTPETFIQCPECKGFHSKLIQTTGKCWDCSNRKEPKPNLEQKKWGIEASLPKEDCEVAE